MGKTGALIGCDKAAMWKRTEGETVTFGTVINLSEKIIATTYDVKIANGSLDAGDKVADSANAKTGAEGTINVVDLVSADRVSFYGETLDGTTNVEKTTDFFPYHVYAWAAKRSDGKYNLYKVMKALFSPESEKVETIKKGSIDYVTTSIKYTADSDGNVIRYVYYGADVTTDATLIENWFTTADYHKLAETP